jgi:hypothetical protein
LRVAIAQHDFESASEPQPHLLHRANLQFQLVATQWACRGHLWCAFVEQLPDLRIELFSIHHPGMIRRDPAAPIDQ